MPRGLACSVLHRSKPMPPAADICCRCWDVLRPCAASWPLPSVPNELSARSRAARRKSWGAACRQPLAVSRLCCQHQLRMLAISTQAEALQRG